MNKHALSFGLIALVFSTSCVWGGPLRDRIKERMESRQQGSEIFAEGDGPSAPIPLPAGARVEREIAYGPNEAQRMDVYLPERPAGPVLFMVHGGAWMKGDKSAEGVVKNKVARWVSRGIITISVNYRLWPDAGPPEQADDVAMALAAAQSKATEMGGDPERFVVMGHSAGAHLVALLAADNSIAERHGAQPWLGTIALDSAAYDVVEVMQSRHYGFYDKVFGNDSNYWRESSPSYRLKGTGGPLLLVCSAQRRDACPQARAFAAKAKAAGRDATVVPIELSHRGINEQLGLPNEYTESVESFLRSIGLAIQ